MLCVCASFSGSFGDADNHCYNIIVFFSFLTCVYNRGMLVVLSSLMCVLVLVSMCICHLHFISCLLTDFIFYRVQSQRLHYRIYNVYFKAIRLSFVDNV